MSEQAIQRKLAAILAADVVGCLALMEADEVQVQLLNCLRKAGLPEV